MQQLDRVGVVGCGLMGAGIAEVAARAGAEVVVVEADEAAAKAGRARVERSLATAVARKKLADDEATAVLGRIQVGPDMDALADRQLVVEAVPEGETIKVETFRRLDDVVDAPDAVLASNTSSIPIMKLAMATRRPEQVIGLHFFNPVPVLPLVELVTSLLTGDETARRAEGGGGAPMGGVQGAAVRRPAAALPHGRRRPVGPQGRPRLLRVRPLTPAATSRPAPRPAPRQRGGGPRTAAGTNGDRSARWLAAAARAFASSSEGTDTSRPRGSVIVAVTPSAGGLMSWIATPWRAARWPAT